MDLSKLSDFELIKTYGSLIEELKNRKIIRTKNIIGDLGEYLAIDFYNKNSNLPKLQFAPTGTENIDAISRKGDRYSIKSTSAKTTGVFYGLNSPDSPDVDEKKFEFVIIVEFDENYNLSKIIELDWNKFLLFKRWHKRMQAWNLTITKELLDNSKIIFDSNLMG